MQTFRPQDHPRATNGQFTQKRLPQSQFRTRKPFIFRGKEHAVVIGHNMSPNGIDQTVTYQQRDRCFVVHVSKVQRIPRFVVIEDLLGPVYEYRLAAHRIDDETASVRITRHTLGQPHSTLAVGDETVKLKMDDTPDLRGVIGTDPETGDRIYNTSMTVFDSADDPDVAAIIARARKLGRLQMQVLENSKTDAETRERITAALEANGLGYAIQDIREQLWSAVGTRMVKSDYEGRSTDILDPIVDASIATLARDNLGISDSDYYALAGPWLRLAGQTRA
ncbi:MAG: hypothetical protein ACYCU8_00445 [Ferrimicrobium acidiphilum]